MPSKNMKLALELKKAIMDGLIAKKGRVEVARQVFNDVMADFAPKNEEEEEDLCAVYITGTAKFSAVALFTHLMSHEDSEECVKRNYTAILHAFSTQIIEKLGILCKDFNIENPLDPAVSEVNKKLVEEMLEVFKKDKD